MWRIRLTIISKGYGRLQKKKCRRAEQRGQGTRPVRRMMIEKIEGIHKDWKKPWFTEGALQWPRNLHGREYNGMNAFMLLLHCEKEGYKIPRFCTFDCVQRLNKPGKDGEELPRVSVLRGENPFRSCSPRSLASIRKPGRKSSMTITRSCPMKKRISTMSIRRCRCSVSSMSRVRP